MADLYEIPTSTLVALTAGDFAADRVEVEPWMEGMTPDPQVADGMRYMEARWAWHEANCPGPNDCRPDCGVHWSEITHGGPASYVDALAESMLSRGWYGDPVEISGDHNRLDDGHHRALAALTAGLESVPVLDLDA